jgi:hypothetical protein
MANTQVTLINTNGVFVPSADSVLVVQGDTVSFSTSDGSSAFAFFSPDALSVLMPAPTNPYAIGAGKTAEFSFSSSRPGAYSAFFAADATAAPKHFPGGNSPTLRLEVEGSGGTGFTGPGDTVGTGHGG